jgi:pheromone shutdown protein TraB
MITLIGTGHIFNLTRVLVNIFEEKQPDILCVELDRQRYNALILKRENPEAYKNTKKDVPIIYKMLARFQEGMANEYGVTAGSEMLTTIDYANSHQLPIAFIDMNAQNIFTKMLKKMTIREKFRLIFSGFGGFIVSKKNVEEELKKIQKDFDSYIIKIGEKFPTIKKILIDERNTYMVQQLSRVNDSHKKIIAVVGDGHIPGLSGLLSKKEIMFETIRLNDLRKFENIETDSSKASFSLHYKSYN